MGDNERNYLLNTLLHVEELIEQQSVSLRNLEKLLNENRKQLIENQKHNALIDERLTVLALELVNLREQMGTCVLGASGSMQPEAGVAESGQDAGAEKIIKSASAEQQVQTAPAVAEQAEPEEPLSAEQQGTEKPAAAPAETAGEPSGEMSAGEVGASVEDEWMFLDEPSDNAADGVKRDAPHDSGGEPKEEKPETAAQDEPEAEEWKPETSAQTEPEAEEWKPETSAQTEPEAEEWKPETAAKAEPETEERKPESAAQAEPEAEEWKPETAAQAESETEERKPESAVQDEPEAEEWKPETAAQAEPKAEEWKPETAAQAEPEAEERKPESAALDEPEAEEWKPETSAQAEPEAEEWKPESAAQAEPEAEEWKPEAVSGDSAQSAESSKSDNEPTGKVSLLKSSLLKSLDKEELLFKGRYADTTWDNNADDELVSSIGQCLEMPSEEAHKALGDLLRLHPWSWRVRLQLFNFEMEEGRPFYAFVVGWPLLYAPMRPAIKKAFKRDMTKVINDVIAYSVTPSEERWKFLRLAELIIDEDQGKALEYVNKALTLNAGVSNEDSRLRYYRQCLAGISQNSFRDCVSALQNIDSHIELFEDLQQSILSYCRGYRAVDDVIQALLHKGRETAKDLESMCELAGEELNVNLLEKVHDDNADLLIELIFNQIYKRIPMPDVTSRTAAEEELLENSTTMTSSNFPPLGLLRRINRLVFGLDYDVKVYVGPQRFWAEVVMGERPTILLHRDCAELDSINQQALLLHRLFQLHHRHHIIRRIHDVMTGKDRLQLMNVLCDITKEAGVDPGVEFRAILNNIKETDNNFEDKLEKLVNAVFMRTGSFEFAAGHELMFAKRPFTDILDAASDRFVARVLGMTDASYSIALRQINDYDLFKKIEDEGFSVIYEPQYSKYFLLRLRLQRLWTAPLQEELWF